MRVISFHVVEVQGRKDKILVLCSQRQYGLDNSGGYKQQQLRHMELEVTRGRMHPSEFHSRKADMLESIAVGIDDGKTKTSGECLKIQVTVLILHVPLEE